MNKKGFTLTELLVTIVILGIITGLAIPVLRMVEGTQTERKYSLYLDNVKYAAKVYVDSYSVDLFESDTGCNYITYKDMSKYNFLKDIDIPETSCNTDYTVVKVVKYYDQYYYSPYIGCGSKINNKVTPDIFKPYKVGKIDTCDGSTNAIAITATPDKSSSNTNKVVSPFVKLVSETGVKKSPLLIEYGYSRGQNIDVINGWTKLTFDVPARDVQENNIKAVRTQTINAHSPALTPKDTGEFYLVIKVTSLVDLQGRPWKEIDEKDNNKLDHYVIIGPYKVDNSAPKINSINVKSSKDTHNDKTPILEIDAVDEKYSSIGELKMCYSYDDKQECPIPKNGEELKNMSMYTKYNSTLALNTINTDYNGSNHKIFVTVADAAGNTTTQSVDYAVSNTHTLTFNTEGGSTCDPIKQIENKPWNAKVIEDAGYANGNFCNTTKAGSTFLGWYTGKDGTGTKINATDLATKDVTAYALWSSTKPSCSITASVKPNANGWNKTNVKLTLNRNGQGITSYGLAKTKNSTNQTTSVTVTANGTTTYYGYVETATGSYTCSYTVKIDKTAPTCGKFTGGSTTWSNAKYRTIKVACKDSGSKCKKTQFSTNVKNEVKTKNVSITIKDKAGNTRICKSTRNIYLDRTAPRYVPKSKGQFIADGHNQWYSYWADSLSGLSTANSGNYSKIYYCYADCNSGCSSSCCKAPRPNFEHRGTDGYYLREADIADNLDNGKNKDRVLMQTLRRCNYGEYAVRADFHICDRANNCSNLFLYYSFD